MALRYFDELLKRVTEEELQAIDEFIAENDAFTVYTNLSRRFEKRPGTLTDVPTSETDTFERRGLKWVMGLARVEYASIPAAFTTTIDPFVAVAPSAFELPAYKSLLMDGVRTHYWALAGDPGVRKVTRTSPSNPVVLAYSRRLGLVRKMLTAAAKVGMSEMVPSQYRELASWKRDLDQLHGGLLMVINAYMTSLSRSKTVTESEREFAVACGMQLAGEQMELKAGTAKVIRFPQKSSGD